MGNECVWKPHINARNEAIMVFLKPGYYCWLMTGAQVKLIKQPEQQT